MQSRLSIVCKFLASGLGLGLIPVAPGTFGSLIAVALFYLLRYKLGWSLEMFQRFSLVVAAASIPIAHVAEKAFGGKDPGKIVIDEVAGLLFCYMFVPYSNFNLLLGFILFRILDVAKIFPARWAQDNFKGGLGVVADDLVAGLQGALILTFFPAMLRWVGMAQEWLRRYGA